MRADRLRRHSGDRVGQRPFRHVEAGAIAAILGLFALATVFVVLRSGQLGFDESLYASKARSLVTATPGPVWRVFRPPGLPILGLATVPFGMNDVNLRVVTAALGVLALGLAWGLARLLWGKLAAVIALLGLIATPVVLAEIRLFHNDLPSAAPILALMTLLWWQFEVRERPGMPLLAAAPLAAAAFYLRFGTLAVLVGVALAAALLWGRRALREPRLVGATLVVAAALFLPHLAEAVRTTGSPLGIVFSAVSQVDTTTPTESAGQYLRWLPGTLAGPAGLILGLAATLGATYAAMTSIRVRHATPTTRRLVWLLVPAGVAALGTIAVSHPEARYMLTALILVEIAGAGAIADAGRWSAERLRATHPRAAAIIGPAMLGGLIVLGAVVAVPLARTWAREARPHWLADAGRAIAADADGPCMVVSTIPPVLGWYSGCESVQFDDPATARSRAASGKPVYVVFTTADTLRASLGMSAGTDVLAEYRDRLTLEQVATTGTASTGSVTYRVVP